MDDVFGQGTHVIYLLNIMTNVFCCVTLETMEMFYIILAKFGIMLLCKDIFD